MILNLDQEIIDLTGEDRIIDLDKPLDEIKLPAFFSGLSSPINLTMCAGDGLQQGITDIEWFTTKKEGNSREKKPTTIFMVPTNYAPTILKLNIEYLMQNKHLKNILLVYDDIKYSYKEKYNYKEKLVQLFPNLIDNIFEDFSCYGGMLNITTLYGILKENGRYVFNPPKFIDYVFIDLRLNYDYLKFFNINTETGIIIKDNSNILLLPDEKPIPIDDPHNIYTAAHKSNPKKYNVTFQEYLNKIMNYNDELNKLKKYIIEQKTIETKRHLTYKIGGSNYKSKYLKYKNKYLELKNQI